MTVNIWGLHMLSHEQSCTYVSSETTVIICTMLLIRVSGFIGAI